jgi:hypothetical protein
MITILVDHDMEGQAFLLWGTLSATGWLELLPMRLVRLTDVGLPDNSTDRDVWRFAQANQMLMKCPLPWHEREEPFGLRRCTCWTCRRHCTKSDEAQRVSLCCVLSSFICCSMR